MQQFPTPMRLSFGDSPTPEHVSPRGNPTPDSRLCSMHCESIVKTQRRRVLVVTTCLLFIESSGLSFGCASNRSFPPRSSLKAKLQKCYTPHDILNFVASGDLTFVNDPLGEVSSNCLVRLAKQLIHIDNYNRHRGLTDAWKSDFAASCEAWKILSTNIVDAVQKISLETTADAESTLNSQIEGIKSMCVISRILPDISQVWVPSLERFEDECDRLFSRGIMPQHLSGLHWAIDVLSLQCFGESRIPFALQNAHEELNLPFRIRPGCMSTIPDFTVQNLVSQVNYQVDDIRTSSNLVVQERRQTSWEGDDGVAPFAYSGKSMPRNSWSPLVKAARDRLMEVSGVYYDGCLLNLYPDGNSGMRYHSDPDQGVLWDYETAVVSLGATRRFSFRQSFDHGVSLLTQESLQRPYTFVLMQGDVVEMFGDCQSKFQHTVRTADDKNEEAARASLVFKRTLIN